MANYEAMYQAEQNAKYQARYDAENNQAKPSSNNPLNPNFYNDMSLSNVPQNLGNLGAGLMRGAGSIGATALAPYDYATDYINGDRKKGLSSLITGKDPISRNEERRQYMDTGFQAMGADPNSGLYATGKLGGEIAGTAGVGNALALGARGLPLVANALRSGGLSLGGTTGNIAKDLALRSGAGAAVAGTAGTMIDPNTAKTSAIIGGSIPLVPPILKGVGNLAANVIGGTLTHTGGESLKQAARAGYAGGERLKTLTDNMRGKVPMEDVLSDVRQNLAVMGQEKSASYRSGMLDISKDKSILSFDGIDNSIGNALGDVSFKGKITNESAYKKLTDVQDIVADWKASNAQEFHTPEGMDKLKQKVGAILEDIPYEQSSSRKFVGDIYHAIKSEISKQAPTYAKVMKDYGDASETISEIKKALIGGNKASADTSMRKLQSIMRNNANSNYGNRADMARKMAEQGGTDIMPALAGQSLNTWTPRGLGGAIAGATGVAGLATLNPAVLGSLLLQSPRLMGETALKTGQASKLISNTANKVTPATAALINSLRGN